MLSIVKYFFEDTYMSDEDRQRMRNDSIKSMGRGEYESRLKAMKKKKWGPPDDASGAAPMLTPKKQDSDPGIISTTAGKLIKSGIKQIQNR